VIKKNRYKEFSEKKLHSLCPSSGTGAGTGTGSSATPQAAANRRILKDSPFSLKYHLLDLEGRQVIRRIAAPATQDFILRIK
jgi:hypothetical protein